MASEVNLGFSVTVDEMDAFMAALKEMQAQSVFAGFPQEEAPREDAAGNRGPITNAALGYIHNTGMPEQNIPARPFMVEGIENKREPISDGMQAVGMAALDGSSEEVEAALNAVGAIARDAIKMKIVEGPFQPLADSTLKARARSAGSSVAKAAQGELDRRDAGEDPGVDLARPLNQTGQMRSAVNYILRKE